MQLHDESIAYCHACGAAMNVAFIAPFSNVECPSCRQHTRVKREFGPYTLLRRHAIGGMSMVFAGHDNTLDREVAIKILSEAYSADEKRIAAFEEEARITASISHPHVVRVLKTGKAFDRFYIAMEMVTGGHLEHQIKERGAIPEVEALTWAIQVAEGLRAAHSVGLLHRDIKPGNILLDSAGSAKIVDFGLALMTKGGIAKPDELWATPFYVPPETVEGLAEDYRADVYAFGATFYHILSGKPPCTEESMVTTQLREAKKKIIPLHLARSELSAETASLIDRAMAYMPSARFTSYEELLAALESALLAASARAKGQRSKIAHPSAATVAFKASQQRQNAKNRFVQRLAIIFALLIVTIAATWAFIQYRSRPAEQNGVSTTPKIAEISPYDDTSSAGIDTASAYESARSLLKQGDFVGSSLYFRRLFDDPQAPDPTRTLCGLESLISDQLNGNNKSSRETSKAILQHLAKGNAPDLHDSLKPWLLHLGKLNVAQPDSKIIDTPLSLFITMSAALKNWESGMPDYALPLFKNVRDAKIYDPTQLAAPYQSLATSYLNDSETLLRAKPKELPNTVAACQELADKLDLVIDQLKTRGRAKFTVREWQIQLKRKASHLSEAQKTADIPQKTVRFSCIQDTIHRLDTALDFASALDALQQTQAATPQETSMRDTQIAMHQAAAFFLSDLAADINKSPLVPPTERPITTKDGRTFEQATAVIDGIVTLAQGATEATVPWSELSTTAMINLYREGIRAAPAGPVLTARHRAAICFQWLSGETDAATAAVARLVSTDPTFKERWEKWMRDLKI